LDDLNTENPRSGSGVPVPQKHGCLFQKSTGPETQESQKVSNLIAMTGHGNSLKRVVCDPLLVLKKPLNFGCDMV
jgi:hypothetical protein